MRILFLIALAASAAAEPFFVDEALRAGLKDVFVCGEERQKNYIVEMLGTGVAFLDFDNDGLLDIFAVTASKLGGFSPGAEPVNLLYRNKGDRTFEDVSKKAGVARAGWGQGVCTGDIDNDGFVDIYVTYWGADVMYRNRGDGTFEDVTPPGMGSRWGTGCAFVDYDRDGKLDLMVANYVDFDLKNTPRPDGSRPCRWKDENVICGPQGLKPALNRLWRNESAPAPVLMRFFEGRRKEFRRHRVATGPGAARLHPMGKHVTPDQIERPGHQTLFHFLRELFFRCDRTTKIDNREDNPHGEEIHSPRIHCSCDCRRGGVVGWRFFDFG